METEKHMKNESHSAPVMDMSRTAVISRFTFLAMNETSLSWKAFALSVVPHYRSKVPRHQQELEFSGKLDLDKAARVDGQHLKRFIDGTNKMPVSLEESWVQSLPEPYRQDCIRALAWRYGLVGAFAEPVFGQNGEIRPECLGRLTKEFSDVVGAASNSLAGAMNTQAKKGMAKELRDLQAEITTMLSKLDGRV